MALVQATIEWDARPYINEVREVLTEVVKDTAEYVEERAARNLERLSPGSTGHLASQVSIYKSEDGEGYIVEAQAGGSYQRYYASFVDLGTYKMPGNGFLRKALRSGKYFAKAQVKKKVDILDII
jgi:hypothetical protein